MLHDILDERGTKMSVNKILVGTNKNIWKQAMDTKLGRLSMDTPEKIKATENIGCIHKRDIPKNSKIIYSNMVCDYRPLKTETNIIRLKI